MSNAFYAGSGFTMQTVPLEPIKTPAGVLVTRSVQTRAGWVGQILVDQIIVWESEPQTASNPESLADCATDAVKLANYRVLDRLQKLFGADG